MTVDALFVVFARLARYGAWVAYEKQEVCVRLPNGNLLRVAPIPEGIAVYHADVPQDLRVRKTLEEALEPHLEALEAKLPERFRRAAVAASAALDAETAAALAALHPNPVESTEDEKR